MTKQGGYWREAATLIIATKTEAKASDERSKDLATFNTTNQLVIQRVKSQSFKYRILMMKRSKRNKFLPGKYVFPGGVISESDFDPKWVDLFEDITHRKFDRISEPFKNRAVVVPLFKDRPISVVPAEIAFRICAVRECFEECGLLIVRQRDDNQDIVKDNKFAHLLSSKDLTHSSWRSRVHADPDQFWVMCSENGLVPDIWSLYEWSNWLTPVAVQVSEPPAKPHRFDTMFYVCCTDSSTQHFRVDNREAVSAQWASPGDLILQHNRGLLPMIEPQMYELSRLSNFTTLDQLQGFASKRETRGLQRCLPVLLFCQDVILNLLPGDEQYPENPDYNGTEAIQVSSQSIEDIKPCGVLNRIVWQPGGKFTIMCNINQDCGHVPPLLSISFQKGKL